MSDEVHADVSASSEAAHFDARARALCEALAEALGLAPAHVRERAHELLARALHEAATSSPLARLAVRAGAAVHDLRNPLGVIETSAYLLSQRPDEPDRVRRHAERITAQTRIAAERVDAVLHEPPAPTLATISLRALLDEALAGWRGAASEAVALRGVDEAPAVRTDRVVFARALHALLDNAREANERAGRTGLELRAAAHERSVELALRDSGGGFSPAKLRAPFAPLATERAGGTGLGLAGARALCDALEGTLRVANDEAVEGGGLGACVTLALPRA